METVKGLPSTRQSAIQEDGAGARRVGRRAHAAGKIQANAQLDSALSRLLVVVENYPQSESQREVSATCRMSWRARKIASPSSAASTTRPFRHYNTNIQLFPNNIVASLSGFQPQRRVFQDRSGRPHGAESGILNDGNRKHTDFWQLHQRRMGNGRRHFRKPQSRQHRRSRRPVREGHRRRTWRMRRTRPRRRCPAGRA